METSNTLQDFDILPNNPNVVNTWIAETMLPFIKGRVLEINSGAGIMAEVITEKQISLTLSDPLKRNRDSLRAKFQDNSFIQGVANIDFSHPQFEETYKEIVEHYHALLVANISRDSFHHEITFRNAKYLLKKNGHLIFVALPFMALYDGYTVGFKEWRRYNYSSIKNAFPDYDVRHTTNFTYQQSATNDRFDPSQMYTLAAIRKS